MPSRPVTDAGPSTIEAWETEWWSYFHRAKSLDIGDSTAWHLLTVQLPILFHLAKLGATVNTDEPTAELFRLAMVGLAHENEMKAKNV